MTARGKRGKRRRTGAVRDAPADPPLALEWSPTARAPIWVSWLLPLVVAVAALVTFWPALDAGFVNWDDDKLFLNNPNYRGLSWTHLQWMFQTTKMGHWQPLSWVSLGLDYLRCGMEPRGYHLTNMLLHAGCAVAFYFLAVRLLALSAGGSASGSVLRVAGALAALFFAVHPLRVESVVWVTERRDLLSGLFFIVTISLYLRSRTASRHRWLWYGCAVVVFILSVLSKAWGMTIPAVLIILDFYPLRRFGVSGRPWLSRETLQACLEKVPFVIVAALIAQKAIDAQGGQVDTLKPLTEHGLTPRVVQVVYGAGFYFWKTLLPTDLVPLYELIQVQRNPFELRFVVTFIGVLVALVAIIVSGRRWPAGLALVGCYLAIYSPVSGIAQSGPQLVKDS
ncbi:MAG: hypothetical protein GY842_01265, partial [bacterium]|nr:hypothetical protein [bacterium]